MSGGYPALPELCGPTEVGVTVDYKGATQVTPSTTANTKGSYVQLTSSLAEDCDMLGINIFYNSTVASAVRNSYDIAIGAGGSEQIIVADLVAEAGQQFGAAVIHLLIPVTIPAGTRIAARSQSNLANDTSTCAVSCVAYRNGYAVDGATGVDTVGFTAATTKGTAVTPNSTGGTKGSYAQLTASAARDYKGFFIGYDANGNAISGSAYYFDVAVGAGGSEVVIAPNLRFSAQGFGSLPSICYFIPVPIAAGQRIAVRCASAGNSDTAKGITFYGVY